MRVIDFLPELFCALLKQLKEDEKRWGTTWLERSRQGQVARTRSRFNEYFDDYYENGVPVPWLKIIGNAMICWIRDENPEYWEKQEAPLVKWLREGGND